MTKVSVVIPVFNQSNLTKWCLQSLLEHSTCVSEVYIINNASQDQTDAILIEFKPLFEKRGVQLQIITSSQNLGFGRACNQGVRETLKGQAQYLVILNNDTWLMPNWDQALIESLQNYQLDCVGPYFYEKPLTENIKQIALQFTRKNSRHFRQHFVPILMCFTRSAAVRLASDNVGTNGGIFDERFFVTYEDTDLLHRMKIMKMKFGQTGSCFIWHHSKGTRDQLPSGYEQEGLRLFQEKWGFDPRLQDHTFSAR